MRRTTALTDHVERDLSRDSNEAGGKGFRNEILGLRVLIESVHSVLGKMFRKVIITPVIIYLSRPVHPLCLSVFFSAKVNYDHILCLWVERAQEHQGGRKTGDVSVWD